MTDRLYYRDSGLRQFEATVVSVTAPQGKCSGSWRVVLDRTAFYPTSGGQPHDTGSLGEARVADVFEECDGTIVHLTDRPVALGPVCGSIDFVRRFDHMQQHTGSHLIVTAFLELYGVQTTSFHLGHEVSTVDLATQSLSQEQLRAVERRCNDIIGENLGVTARMQESIDLGTALPGHRAPKNKVPRVVEIEGRNVQPCGGTHVQSTAQIGLLLLRRLMKAKGNCRLEFFCGGRAARAVQDDLAVMQAAAQQLSCTFANLPEAISRIAAERDSYLRASERMREEMAALQADVLLAHHPRTGGSAIVHIFENRDFGYLKLVALQLIKNPGTVALLGTAQKGEVVFAQAHGLPTDMRALFKSAVLSVGGKGGGTREFAQGIVRDPRELGPALTQAAVQLRERLSQGIPTTRGCRGAGLGTVACPSAIGD
jgi:alanyl-tRNA synthetase